MPNFGYQIYNDRLEYVDRFPDLTGGRRTEFLTLRVSARGRDARPGDHGNAAGAEPLEWHRIEAWPVTGAAPRVVLRRDETTRYWENSSV